jgi:hypothetical protein
MPALISETETSYAGDIEICPHTSGELRMEKKPRSSYWSKLNC